MSLKISSLGIFISPFRAENSKTETEHKPYDKVVSTMGNGIASRCENKIAPDPP